MRYEISILPFSGIDSSSMEHLKDDLAAIGITATLLPDVSFPNHAYNASRHQYDGHILLQYTREQAISGVCLGVTDRDLYVDGLNFIFGLADSPGSAAIISLYRLAAGVDQHTFYERAVKEAVHELGHTLGLEHCQDPSCVMYFSNTLLDTDRKGKMFCSVCRDKLRTFE